jgi:hypothetical protein
VFGGAGKICGIGRNSPRVLGASVTGNTLINNDVGVALFNVNNTCTKSVRTPLRDLVCHNVIRNYPGYAGGVASADANVSGFVIQKHGAIGDEAGGAEPARSARPGRPGSGDDLDADRFQPADFPPVLADVNCQPGLADTQAAHP